VRGVATTSIIALSSHDLAAHAGMSAPWQAHPPQEVLSHRHCVECCCIVVVNSLVANVELAIWVVEAESGGFSTTRASNKDSYTQSCMVKDCGNMHPPSHTSSIWVQDLLM
jgi:hypothetical protein